MPLPPSSPLIDFSREIYTVSRLNAEVRAVLDASFPLLWVQGELSNLSQPASGHLYFSLKDGASQVRCALFRGKRRLLAMQPRNGQQVLARARVGLYEARGDFQLIVEHLEPAGDGALRLALDQLKQRLADEGLFDGSRKRSLPRYPRQVGLITSASGAALHDLLTVLASRFPLLPVLIYPVAVQGDQAATGLIAAVELANRRRDCDVLIIARGGGSLEDLMPFNDEHLARAIAASPLPVVTGIGHDVDVSIADLVADQRGATPSAAAALVAPDGADARQQVVLLGKRLRRALRYRLADASQRLTAIQRHLQLLHPRARLEQRLQRVDELTRRLEYSARQRVDGRAQRHERLQQRLQQASPRGRVRHGSDRLARASERLRAAAAHAVERRRQRLAALGVGLQARSPLSTLGRGYALVTDTRTGALVRSPEQLAPGVAVSVRVAGGRFRALVMDSPADGALDASEV